MRMRGGISSSIVSSARNWQRLAWPWSSNPYRRPMMTALRGEERPVLVCADESAHLARDIPKLADRYDMVNIKLDKAGGLTGAIEAVKTAEQCGLQVMIGCMVGTSLSMMPGLLLAEQARFVDLDGPLWIREDRSPGLVFEDGMIQLPRQGVWQL